jgi:hypothetical protein
MAQTARYRLVRGYPTWIRTMTKASKGLCATVTPSGIEKMNRETSLKIYSFPSPRKALFDLISRIASLGMAYDEAEAKRSVLYSKTNRRTNQLNHHVEGILRLTYPP